MQLSTFCLFYYKMINFNITKKMLTAVNVQICSKTVQLSSFILSPFLIPFKRSSYKHSKVDEDNKINDKNTDG